MSTGNFILICIAGGFLAVFIQMILSAKYKKDYMQVLKSGGSKSDCIKLGRKYYKSLSKSKLKAERITDIETRISGDLQMHNIN